MQSIYQKDIYRDWEVGNLAVHLKTTGLYKHSHYTYADHVAEYYTGI